jgi:hypothetical protein
VKRFLQTFIPAALTLVITLFVGAAAINAQVLANVPASTSSAANLIKATEDYKTSSAELLALQEFEVNKAAANLEELRALVAEGLVAKASLEEEEPRFSRRDSRRGHRPTYPHRQSISPTLVDRRNEPRTISRGFSRMNADSV